ncbi:MAG TPA: hypothetical protein VGP63_08310, partial [Planctomycetaceae bacterium]|nr:hypothetical protein [Planctomycetaceae bacterium]
MNRRVPAFLVFAAVAIGRVPVCKANGDPGFVPSFSLNTSSSSIKGQYPLNSPTRIRIAPDSTTGDIVLPINLQPPKALMPIAGSSTFQYSLSSLTITDTLGNAPVSVSLDPTKPLPATLDLGSSGKAANRSITITATAKYTAQVIPKYVADAQGKAASDAATYAAAAAAAQAAPTDTVKQAAANTAKANAAASQQAATAAATLVPNPLLYMDIPEQTSIVVYLDTTPPIVDSVVVNPLPGAGGTIVITLRDSDLDQTTIAQGDFDVEMLVGTTTTAATVGPTTNAGAPTPNLNQQVPIAAVGVPSYDAAARTITLTYNQLGAGNYSITVSKLADRVGNVITASPGDPTNPRTFNVTAGRLHGKQIEYPEFLTPEDRRGTFDPADKVETRRVNLYYFRDAHRVAEIINRNTQHLNQTGYDAAQRIAQDARAAADNKTLERRTDEFQAVEAARNTRATRKQYQDTLQQLTAAQQQNAQLQNQNAEIQNTATSVAPPPGTAASATPDIASKLAAYQAAVADNEQQTQALQQSATPLTAAQQQQLTALQSAHPGLVTNTNLLSSLQIQQQQNGAGTTAIINQITQLNGAADQLRTTLNEAQKSDVNTRLTLQQAEQQETLLKAEQFRREVAAGLTDLDTYAAGKLTSIDPVTQVTLTVVGEGVIELRGPVKGINKICRIIHDIDTPVGQVKVGIHTVQVNGEHGDRMELVYEQIEKHIAHSRFLSNQAGQLIRKATA